MNGEQLKKYIPDTAVHSMQIKDVKYIYKCTPWELGPIRYAFIESK
jgi:hypothetical protein